jgi:hypothetical protein
MGLKYEEDFELKLMGKTITDDDIIIDDSLYKEPVYEVQIHSSFNDYRNLNQTEKMHKLEMEYLDKFFELTTDSLILDENIQLYNLKTEDEEHIDTVNAYKVDWKH